MESIAAIKSNYPPEHYTLLRKALDNAVKALESIENLQERNEYLENRARELERELSQQR